MDWQVLKAKSFPEIRETFACVSLETNVSRVSLKLLPSSLGENEDENVVGQRAIILFRPHPISKGKNFNLRHGGQDKMAAIFQATFLTRYSWMEMYAVRSKFHWSLFLGGPINNNLALVGIMDWRRPGDKPLTESMMFSLLRHICVTRP